MSISRIKQIKRILAHGDVRDPRAALVAIEGILSQEKPKADKPLIKVVGHRGGSGAVGLSITTDKSIKPIELFGVLEALRGHGDEIFGVERGKPVTCDLAELFKKFEADAIKAAGVKEGGAE